LSRETVNHHLNLKVWDLSSHTFFVANFNSVASFFDPWRHQKIGVN
jgi:hypothetical protein